jgi:hypothetical protein
MADSTRDLGFAVVESEMVRLMGVIADLTNDVREIASCVRAQQRQLAEQNTAMLNALRLACGDVQEREALVGWLDEHTGPVN